MNLRDVLRIEYRETRVAGNLVYLNHSLQQQTKRERKPFNQSI